MFSKTYGYALRATVCIAQHSSDYVRISLKDVAQTTGVPTHFLGKILQDLVKHGIFNSAKGPNGGFFVNERTLTTKLDQILIITDGSLFFQHCALGQSQCNAEKPCLLHHEFSECRAGILQIMATKTIKDLVEDVNLGRVFLSVK